MCALTFLSNESIADRLVLYAALLDLNGAQPYAGRAFRKAADVIRDSPGSVAELVRSGKARQLRGVGPGVEARLRELVDTGTIAESQRLELELQPELSALGHLLGISVKRMLSICRALRVTTADEFRAAADSGRLQEAPGIGPSREARIRDALALAGRPRRGLTLDRAWRLLEEISAQLQGMVAGDPRRFCALSYDLAIVTACHEPSRVIERFGNLPSIVTILDERPQVAVGLTIEGLPVRLIVTEPERLGTELVRATGSTEYVASLEPLPDASDEEAVFASKGVAWRPPELRELPLRSVPEDLVDRSDIRGDLHCHTRWSDGRASVLEMAIAARDQGHEYLAICDHTPNVRVVAGLDSDDLRRQGEEIAEVNEAVAPFRVLRGVECDILQDGSLDVADDVLVELDWVQISLHAGQRRDGSELTRIVSEAMRHPYVRALSHPTGRILNHRPENDLDLMEVFSVAVETGVALEINGLPSRLDLSSEHASAAFDAGVHVVVASDAHSTKGLTNIDLAVHTARRAGIPRQGILNTRPLRHLLHGRLNAGGSRAPTRRSREA